MAETRVCAQCGMEFAPRREHARFCSARCRVAWNRANTGALAAGASALGWSMTAMSDVTTRLARVRASDWPRALAVIGEAVWWVTLVDATLVRYHPDTYDAVLAGQSAAERRSTEGILAGLRFVRNQMGLHLDPADFIEPAPDGAPGASDTEVTAWRWNSLPAPACASLSARAQRWEMMRYRAYQSRLAGHTVGETFERAADFLSLTAMNAPAIVDPGAHAAG
ncbi:MAG: hypothetical protein JOY82_07310 [Streptosporangiaceae bacterium]|nr:hypothetical protein [Streptosporangiaceae bacterium]MBV9854323.1 hypothetical protein [Streptosporangiaceae bacterium]